MLSRATYFTVQFLFWGWLFMVMMIPKASAQFVAPVDLDGYAWSSTVGWISFNCATGGLTGNNICATSNYKVSIDADGDVSGYAWSNNVGWIKFGGLSSFPSQGGTYAGNARVVGSFPNYTFEGWARACAGTDNPTASEAKNCSVMTLNDNSGNWDGWISLRKTTATAYSVRLDRTTGMASNSYAWGSTVVGWIDMSSVTFVPLSSSLSGTACQIPLAGSSCIGRLTWTIHSSAPSPSIYNVRTSSNVSTNYSGTNQTVTLNQGSTEFTARTGTTELQSVTLTPTCVAGTSWNGTVCGTPPPVITITADRSMVRNGGTAQLTWTINRNPLDDGSCTVAGPGISQTGVTTNGSQTSAALSGTSNFDFSCTGTYGTVSARATVEVVPVVTEI